MSNTPPPDQFGIVGILTKDADLRARLQQAKEELERNTKNVAKVTEEVNSHYTHEIEEGTKKKQLLLEQGTYLRGEADDGDPLKSFCPSRETPHLNALFFMMRDQTIDTELKALRAPEDISKNVDDLRQEFELEFGTAFDAYEASQVSSPDFVKSSFKNATKGFESFLYEGGNYDAFVKLKKLKALTRSANTAEAELAKAKCLELCEKYNLDYDRIPSF